MNAAKPIAIRSRTGYIKRIVELVSWSDPELRKTHNGTTRFKYQTGIDAAGVIYETNSKGNGWRVKR